MSTARVIAEQLGHVGPQHLRTYSLGVRLIHAGFVEREPVEGLKVYERHSGVYSIQVRHDTDRGHVSAWLAFRGEQVMKYRPWSVPLAGEKEVVAEVLSFLRTVGGLAVNLGD
jgi:hypothetical protein